MDLRKLKKLIDLVEESGVSELEITEGEEKVRIVKHSAPVLAPPSNTFITTAPPSTTPLTTQTDTGNDKAAVQESLPSGEIITSPMVGTFYRASSPGSAPFVDIGTEISHGQCLCIIEAMKLMNEIEAEVEGKIKAILVENGQPVEYGQPLMIVE